ncbi:MAG: SelB C-terminal domain-containing protein, partial [Acidobacteriales bacterium]|nr:SelB C-terminal domain-containing protein [Terriglobales bacterium]
GGVVLDAHPLNKRLTGPELIALLTRLRNGAATDSLLARIERRTTDGMDVREAIKETGWSDKQLEPLVRTLETEGKIVTRSGTWIAGASWAQARRSVIEGLREFHAKNPLAAGSGRDSLRERLHLREPVFSACVNELVHEKEVVQLQDVIHLAGHQVKLKSDESAARAQIEKAFQTAGLQVPAMREVLMSLPIDRTRAQKIVAILLRDKVLVKVNDELTFHASALGELRNLLTREKAKSPSLDVKRFKELTGVSRKYAIPLLEWLDRERVTRRVGEARVILS